MTHGSKIILRASAALLFICASCGPVFGQAWARKMFTEFSHDFGDVIKGDRPVYQFEIQNVFQEDIHIAGVYSSCGCTTVSVEKNLLKTWEKTKLNCRFNSPTFDGNKTATVTVRFNRPYVGEVQLNIRGRIVNRSGLNITPKSIDFGVVSKSKSPSRTVELTSFGNPNFRVLDVKSTFSHIKVQLRQKSRQNNRVQYELKTSLKDSVPEGFAEGQLFVVVQEGNQTRQVPIDFSGKVISPGLRISPEILTLNGVEPGQEVRKKVILKGTEPFRIVDVTCRSKAFRVRAGKDAKKVHVIEVIYKGEPKAGQHECELSFYTDMTGDDPNMLRALVEIVEPADAESENVSL